VDGTDSQCEPLNGTNEKEVAWDSRIFFDRTMENLLNTKVEYQTTETSFGTWRRFLYTNGAVYSEFTSRSSFIGWPLLHISRGRSPETGKIAAARGIIAIGQKAVGVLAIGQAAFGLIAIGQLSIGLLIGVGQAATGILAIGQAAAGIFAIGQFGIGIAGISQSGGGLFLHSLWAHHS
jgi:hypothetical protein